MSSKLIYLILLLIFGGALLAFLLYRAEEPQTGAPLPPPPTPDIMEITSFEECVEQGYPVQESYPPRCVANGQTFVQEIGNELEKSDLIRVDNPRPNAVVSSPLVISGEARGNWYFEADFPVYLYDANGNQTATGIAQAQGEWMTEDFVPFEVTLTFENPDTPTGELVLEKDNPSGLPENADELRIPVTFE